MLKELIRVNRALKEERLVIFTWGNASCRSVDKKSMFIKPSGVPFEELQENKISQVDLSTAKHLRGLQPSVDAPTHIVLYNAFPDINAIVHTHSKYCTIFAQSKLSIPCLGTTHSDYFYEKNTGLKIIQYFNENNVLPMEIPAALSPSHGVFVWGETLTDALKNAIVLENVAEMAYKTLQLCYNRSIDFNSMLLNKHFLRKHGNNKYYGQ